MIEVREARESEFVAMARMKARAWRQSHGDLIPEAIVERQSGERAIQNTAERWRISLDQGNRYWVVLRDEAIVGVAHGGEARDADAPVPLELTMIYLLDIEKGRGTADRLLAAAIGSDPCLVWVLRDNGRAIRFYERHGFVLDGVEKPAFATHPDIREVRMVRRGPDHRRPTGGPDQGRGGRRRGPTAM